MTNGERLLTVAFHGAERVVEEFNLMRPVKAAPEVCVRHSAAEPGPKRIRIHALSTGPLKTRAASGIQAGARTSEHRPVSIQDAGNPAAFLVGGAAAVAGNIGYVDAGCHIGG
jgi:enoyl-[acyl-carrier protein] reductase I